MRGADSLSPDAELLRQARDLITDRSKWRRRAGSGPWPTADDGVGGTPPTNGAARRWSAAGALDRAAMESGSDGAVVAAARAAMEAAAAEVHGFGGGAGFDPAECVDRWYGHREALAWLERAADIAEARCWRRRQERRARGERYGR